MSLRIAGLGAAVLANMAYATGGMPNLYIPDATVQEDYDKTINVDSANRMFIDGQGRQVIFHGVNVVYKVDPYIPGETDFDSQDSLNDEDIANLVSWGQNFVRLGVMWEAVERERGVYDDAYLDKVEQLINKLGEAGIYTLVDAHQDVFARVICGEGIPDFYAQDLLHEDSHCISWAADRMLKGIYEKLGVCLDMNDFDYEKDENGDPLITECQKRDFYIYYLTKQSMAAFGGFFTNKQGV